MARTWKDVRSELNISTEDEAIIALEKDLIKTMVKIREEKEVPLAKTQ